MQVAVLAIHELHAAISRHPHGLSMEVAVYQDKVNGSNSVIF